MFEGYEYKTEREREIEAAAALWLRDRDIISILNKVSVRI
jgi:hypothetical protein